MTLQKKVSQYQMNKYHLTLDMDNYLIEFDKIPWESPQKGIQQKTLLKDHKQIRLVMFDDQFEEIDWCTKEHIGFIIEGQLNVNFIEGSKIFNKGNGLCIPENHPHKVKMAKKKTAKVILFESIKKDI